MNLLFNTHDRRYEINLKGATTQTVGLGDDALGNITRLDNSISNLDERARSVEQNIENLKKQKSSAECQVQKPFAQENELNTKLARLSELNALLNMDVPQDTITDNEQETSVETGTQIEDVETRAKLKLEGVSGSLAEQFQKSCAVAETGSMPSREAEAIR